jgi:hypothetical protein
MLKLTTPIQEYHLIQVFQVFSLIYRYLSLLSFQYALAHLFTLRVSLDFFYHQPVTLAFVGSEILQ